jgi:hypothetical protein
MNMIKIFIYMYESRIAKPLKLFKMRVRGMKKSHTEGKFDQSTLYTYVETAK